MSDLNSLPLKQAALEYARRGFCPIPCEGKRPIVEWKEWQGRVPSDQQIDAWWEKAPNANVALVLGWGVYAVDVDGPEGHAALAMAGVTFPENTPTSMTGKGVHYLVRGVTGDRIGLLPKVDIKGKGIIVVPPSIHPSGAQYRWLVSPDAIPEAPGALRGLLESPVKAEMAPGGVNGPGWLAEALAGVGQGVRNATCARLAGYFLGKGTPKEAVIQLLLSWADRCAPRFPTNEVYTCVESIAHREGVHTDEPKTIGDQLLTVSGLYAATPDEHEWIVEDYIPRGALVMLASEEKVGKSTLTYALTAAVAKGQPFIGRRVTKAGVLLLAVEEHKTDVKIRSIRFGLTSDDPVSYYVGDLPNDEMTLRDLKSIVMTQNIGLVILDTLGHQLANVLESENDNTAAIKAMKPWLHLARDTHAAVLMIHHTGKQGGMYRGASSFGGIVDQILTLRHAGGNQRDLEARGRYWTTPKRLRIVLDGNEYRALA